MTIEQYLRGKVDINLNENTLAAILFDRGIAEGANLSSVTERQKDLALADLYMFAAGSSTSASGEYDSDGGWQRQRSAKNVYNRPGLIALAKALYAKWGEAVDDSIGKVKMKPLY